MADNDTADPGPAPETTPATDQAPDPSPVPYDRFKQVNDRAKAAEAELAKLQKAQSKAAEDALKEQQKWQQLYEGALPKIEQADRYEKALADLLEAQVSAVPEDKRDLIPGGDPVDQLAWLQKATARGLFAPPAQSPGNPPPARRGQPNLFDVSKMTPEEIRKARKEGKISFAG